MQTPHVGSLVSIDGIVLNTQPAVVPLATIDYLCRLLTGTVGGDSARPAAPKYLDASLTEREQEIILLAGRALSNKNIAERLCISSTTVRHHLTRIFDKLGVTSRQKFLLRAHQHGLVEFRALV